MKILITGANGQLGSFLQGFLSETDSILALGSHELDISQQLAVLDIFNDFKPDVIINAAAYTAVDKAESEAEIATDVNCIGPRNLAIAAKEVGARLIHVSTDYVFDGSGNVPYL